MRDRHVSCLPRWTVCPTRSPSQDTNRSTCRGECSWSGPLATPPGRCHLGPLANGPGRNPPYCLRSGGADTDTGGAPKTQRSGTSPASFAGSCHPGSPPFVAALVPASCFRPQGRPPVPRPLPCPLAPAMSRLPLLSAPALACWCSLLFVCFFFLVPCPPPCPLAVSSLSSPFSWVGGGVGGGGGGALAVRPIAQARRKHGAGTRRGTCRSAGGGGGLAVWLPPSPYPSCGCTPGGPPVGACTARAPFGHGRVVRSALSFLCLPTLPRRPRGGGVRFPLPSSPMSPRLPPAALAPFLGGCGSWGWGGGGALAALPPA